MRFDTINTLMSTPPYAGLFLLGTGAVIGRNYIGGVVSKIGGIVTSKLGIDAATWNESSEHYFQLAKKHTFRDLKLVAGLAALYAAVAAAKNMSTEVESSRDLGKKSFEEMDRDMGECIRCDSFSEQITNCTKLFEDYRSLKREYFFLQVQAILVSGASILATGYQLRRG